MDAKHAVSRLEVLAKHLTLTVRDSLLLVVVWHARVLPRCCRETELLMILCWPSPHAQLGGQEQPGAGLMRQVRLIGLC
jgi:hypothetical protein